MFQLAVFVILLTISQHTNSQRGPPGPPGDTGATGMSGSRGSRGATGARGATGLRGGTGWTGFTGRTASGFSGSRGPRGPKGRLGWRGYRGRPGYLGARGATGGQGDTGATGASGPSNIVHDVPTPLCQGPRGPPGPRGATGATGATGGTGWSVYRGPRGSTGSTGSRGLRGLAGGQGYRGSRGSRGYTGYRGPTGRTGYTGVRGPVGATGEAGATGIQIQRIRRVRRAAGCPGPKGPPGYIGATGSSGATGSTGATGFTGFIGRRGGTGATGATGYRARTGPPGYTGYRGLTGHTGYTGRPGAAGDKGSTGATGPPGVVHTVLADCVPRWNSSADQYSNYGVLDIQYGTVHSCLDLCIRESSCVAVDFNFNINQCWVHINAGDLTPANTLSRQNTYQYRIDRTCPPQTTADPQACPALQLGIAIPTQSNPADWAYTIQFVTSVIQQLDIGREGNGIQVGVVTYRGSTEERFNLDQYRTKEELIRAIELLPTISNSGNDIAGAMRALRSYALTHGGRPFVQKVALTFVDQRASHRGVLEDILQEFNDDGIVSKAVGLTRSTSALDLLGMSSSDSDYLRFPGSYRDLQGRVSDTVRLLCPNIPDVSRTTPDTTTASTQLDLVLILGVSLGPGVLLVIIIIINVLCICCPCCPMYRVCCRQKPRTDRQQNPTRDHPMSDLSRPESYHAYAELDENAQRQAGNYEHIQKKY